MLARLMMDISLKIKKVYDIYREVSISKEKLQKILERIKAVL